MSETELASLKLALQRQAEAQREADHRVKNHLQLISSVILLHSRRAGDAPTKDLLRSVLRRVSAVSLAQRHAMRDGADGWVDAAELIRDLVADLAATAGRDDVEIILSLDQASVPGRHAAPLALLAGEAVANALAHAFPGGRAGQIEIVLRAADAALELAVADNGVGLATAEAAPGFGSSILQLMGQQLRASLVREDAQPGVRLVVSVPMDTAQSPRS